jgi:hypothetical protein
MYEKNEFLFYVCMLLNRKDKRIIEIIISDCIDVDEYIV